MGVNGKRTDARMAGRTTRKHSLSPLFLAAQVIRKKGEETDKFQPQGITALWLVLIALTHEGTARLS